MATLAVRLGRDARFFDHSLVLGAALSRDDIDVRFEGEGGECGLDGLFVRGRPARRRHALAHRPRAAALLEPRSSTRASWTSRARGVFNGLVIVRPGAQKTDAWQMNRNLLLSSEALVHSTPQLEILADDVKCKHGSTTGQLDPAALFYLRSRGIGEAEARGLLTWAFASELLQQVAGPGRARARSSGGCRRGCPAWPGWWRRRREQRAASTTAGFDVAGACAREFPVLRETVNGHPLVYLDSAASAQKPQAVIDAERAVYEHYYSNIHRGVHRLSMLVDRGLRGGARQDPRVPRRRLDARGGAAARHDRGDQPGGPELRPPPRGRGRRGADHRARAPLEHRALAAAVRGEGRRRCGSRRSTTPARSTWRRSSACSRRARRSWP